MLKSDFDNRTFAFISFVFKTFDFNKNNVAPITLEYYS